MVALATHSRRVAVYRSPILPLSETFIRDQVLYLSRWQATLVGETPVTPSPALDGVNVKTLYADSFSGRLKHRADRLAQRLSGHSPAKKGLLQAVDPDLVHVHFATDAVGLWPTVERFGVPMVVTLHGYDINTHADWWRAGHGGREKRSFPDRLLAMAQSERVHFIAVSNAIRLAALAYGLPDTRIAVKHTGIDVRQFTPGGPPLSSRPPTVLFIGRLVEKKGCTYLIQAAARLRERVPRLRLTIIGDGPERPALVAEAARLGVPADFLGAQDQEEVRRRIGHARAFCLPSVTAQNGDAEGFGMVILEAQAAGVPVVTSAKGGSDEGIVDQQTGFAFAERDVPALTRALEILMLDGTRIDRMSALGIDFVRQRFDILECTRELESHYDRIVGDPQSHPRPSNPTASLRHARTEP